MTDFDKIWGAPTVILQQAVVMASTNRAQRNCDGHFQLAIDLGAHNGDGKGESAGAAWSWEAFLLRLFDLVPLPRGFLIICCFKLP